MKTLIIVVLALFLLPITPAFASDSGQDKWFAQDKAVHVGVAGASSVLAYNLYRKTAHCSKRKAKWLSVLTVVAAGAIKEATDDRFSWKDMTANAVGAGIGAALAMEF
jgi:uncharacterized protein YfiM (DUF2279 family)